MLTVGWAEAAVDADIALELLYGVVELAPGPLVLADLLFALLDGLLVLRDLLLEGYDLGRLLPAGGLRLLQAGLGSLQLGSVGTNNSAQCSPLPRAWPQA